ncbi:hypothetical protein CIY_25830 [Butyrivibrio fibrisolvens 16/4]|nr:hypothetical protein CIY_25830 [Butyrivibrio fibrisolvens 16/4]
MNIKKIVKQLIYPFNCFRHGISNHEGYIYIGKACKFVRPKRMQFAKGVCIMPYTMLVALKDTANISIGERSEIGMFSRIGCIGSVEIGNHVLTGPHVFIADYNHEYRDISKPIMYQGNTTRIRDEKISNKVVIGDDTWLGTNVVVVGTVTIGKHCVIGANSVVTQDIPDYCVAAGIPCKIIKKYNFGTGIWEKYNNDNH